MKVSGQEMKVTLTVYDRERTFSEQELIAILEKHFSSEANEQVSEENVLQGPIEGQWFEVDPSGINTMLFIQKRKDEKQEKVRQIILEAFNYMQSNPGVYGRKFKTMIPKKTWESATVFQLTKLAHELGDGMATMREQAFEWAQRIANGEDWETVCNLPDTADWYRLIIGVDGRSRKIGGSRQDGTELPASDVGTEEYCFKDITYYDVPLVMRYAE